MLQLQEVTNNHLYYRWKLYSFFENTTELNFHIFQS